MHSACHILFLFCSGYFEMTCIGVSLAFSVMNHAIKRIVLNCSKSLSVCQAKSLS